MNIFMTTAITVAIPLVLNGGALSQSATKHGYETGLKEAAAAYHDNAARCDPLSGNPNDVCSVAAKDKEAVDPANLEVRNANTHQARCLVFVTAAKADDRVAKGKCHGRTGNVIEIPPWFNATPSMSGSVV
jgi:hypothetical protein